MKKKVKVSSKKTSKNKKKKKNKDKSKAPVVPEEPSTPEWTIDRQKQLEQAMRTVPRDVDDRWACIAAEVDGMSRADCIARFKEIREMLRARREQQQQE